MILTTLAIAALGAFGLGIKKGIDAKNYNDQARQLIAEAQSMQDKANNSLQKAEDKFQTSANNLASKKQQILSSTLDQFVRTVRRIKDVQGVDEIKVEVTSIVFKKKVRKATQMKIDGLGKTLLRGAGIGVLLGIPVAVCISGFIASKKAEANYYRAKRDYELVKTYVQGVYYKIDQMNNLRRECNMYEDLLGKLEDHLLRSLNEVENIFNSRTGFINFIKYKILRLKYNKFSQREQNTIAACFTIAKAVSAAIKAPLVTSSQSLCLSSQARQCIENGQQLLIANRIKNYSRI